MASYRIRRRVMTERVVRVIAILFLVYTGADLTVPEFCREEMGIPKFVSSSSSTDTGIGEAYATDTSESRQQDLPSEPTHSDEDCFCCCNHVVPAHYFQQKIVDLNFPSISFSTSSIYLSTTISIYHPPRIS